MKRKVRAGVTSVSLPIIVYDNTSTTGAGLGGLTHTTSGLVLEYRRQGQSTWTQLGVGTGLVSKTLGTFTSGGIVASGSRTGRYEIDIPDAALASGARFVEICLRGAANMHPVDIEIELDAVDYQDATAFGLSRLDAAVSSRMATYTQPTGFLAATFPATVASPTNITSASGVVLAATTHTGAVIPTVSTVTNGVTVGTNNDKTGYALTQAFPSNFAALGITVGGAVTVGTNNDKTGYSLAVAPPTAATIADAVWDEAYNQHTTAGTFGKLMDILRKANYVTEGSVAAGGTPTTTVFRTDLTAATSTYDNQTLLFISGSLEGQSAPIESYSQTNGTMTLGDALTAAPTAGDGFVILPDHVHPISEIAAALAATEVMIDLDTMIINDGTATARFSTSALQNAPTGGGGGGTGTGARTVAITVTLSAAPVEGASVRLTKAAETYVGSTNASGQITFNVDDGTWTVSITSPNATFSGASLVVDDDETASYSLTAISITPSPAGQMTGYWTCYSHLGVVESGVSVTMQLVDVPKGSKGLALDSRLRTVTANGSGVAQFTNLFPGCRYKVYRGAADNKAFYVTLPEVAPADPVELGSFYGDDE
jgi:hypothetical protein